MAEFALGPSVCWNCLEPEAPPMRARGDFLGCFCSAPCALRYVLDIRSHDAAALHAEIAVHTAEPAPPRRLLRAFGGPLDPSDYRGAPPSLEVVPSRPELFQITAAGGGAPIYEEFVKRKKKEARRKAAK